jgi:hypothetical protein
MTMKGRGASTMTLKSQAILAAMSLMAMSPLLLVATGATEAATPNYRQAVTVIVRCVPLRPTTCRVSLATRPDMDVELRILLPPNSGFYLNTVTGVGPTSITPPNGFTSGTGRSYVVQFSTPAHEPRGSKSILTFVLKPPKHG